MARYCYYYYYWYVLDKPCMYSCFCTNFSKSSPSLSLSLHPSLPLSLQPPMLLPATSLSLISVVLTFSFSGILLQVNLRMGRSSATLWTALPLPMIRVCPLSIQMSPSPSMEEWRPISLPSAEEPHTHALYWLPMGQETAQWQKSLSQPMSKVS